ncbi:hypothetical protein RQP46_001367 [Phenoliferia psychrophenolica]
MHFSPAAEAALKTSVGLAAGVACISGLTIHQRIGQMLNALTLGCGAWEILKLAALRRKGSRETKTLVWSLLVVKVIEQSLITICTFYPVYNAVTMDRPQLFVYNWGMICCFPFTYVLRESDTFSSQEAQG